MPERGSIHRFRTRVASGAVLFAMGVLPVACGGSRSATEYTYSASYTTSDAPRGIPSVGKVSAPKGETPSCPPRVDFIGGVGKSRRTGELKPGTCLITSQIKNR